MLSAIDIALCADQFYHQLKRANVAVEGIRSRPEMCQNGVRKSAEGERSAEKSCRSSLAIAPTPNGAMMQLERIAGRGGDHDK